MHGKIDWEDEQNFVWLIVVVVKRSHSGVMAGFHCRNPMCVCVCVCVCAPVCGAQRGKAQTGGRTSEKSLPGQPCIVPSSFESIPFPLSSPHPSNLLPLLYLFTMRLLRLCWRHLLGVFFVLFCFVLFCFFSNWIGSRWIIGWHFSLSLHPYPHRPFTSWNVCSGLPSGLHSFALPQPSHHPKTGPTPFS